MAGVIMTDSLIRRFGSSEKFNLSYSVKIEPVKIESVKNSSTKRKHTED